MTEINKNQIPDPAFSEFFKCCSKAMGEKAAEAVLCAYRLSRPYYLRFNSAYRGSGHTEDFISSRVGIASLMQNCGGDAYDICSVFIAPARADREITREDILASFGGRENEVIKRMDFVFGIKQKARDVVALSSLIDSALFINLITSYETSLMKSLNSKKRSNAISIQNAVRLIKNALSESNAERIAASVTSLRAAFLLSELGADSETVCTALLLRLFYMGTADENTVAENVGIRVKDALSAARVFISSVNTPSGTEKAIGRVEKAVNTPSEKDINILRAVCAISSDASFSLPARTDGSESSGDVVRRIRGFCVKALNILGVKELARHVEDSLWKYTDSERYREVFEKTEALISENRRGIYLMTEQLTYSVDTLLNIKYGFPKAEIKTDVLLPYDVYKLISPRVKNYGRLADSINKRYIPLITSYILVPRRTDTDVSLQKYAQAFLSAFAESDGRHKGPGAVITDVTRTFSDGIEKYVFSAEELTFVKMTVTVMYYDDYRRVISGIGNEISSFCRFSSEKNKKDGLITVYLRNGAPVKVPSGATALDVAFKIHEELGYAAKNAEINGYEQGIETELCDGDSVVIIADTARKNGITEYNKPHVRIDWVLKVRTEEAREKIVRWLQDKYNEGDEPGIVPDAPDSDVKGYSTDIIGRLPDLSDEIDNI